MTVHQRHLHQRQGGKLHSDVYQQRKTRSQRASRENVEVKDRRKSQTIGVLLARSLSSRSTTGSVMRKHTKSANISSDVAYVALPTSLTKTSFSITRHVIAVRLVGARRDTSSQPSWTAKFVQAGGVDSAFISALSGKSVATILHNTSKEIDCLWLTGFTAM